MKSLAFQKSTTQVIKSFFKKLFNRMMFFLAVLIIAGILLVIIEGVETYGTDAPNHIPTINQIKHTHISFHVFTPHSDVSN